MYKCSILYCVVVVVVVVCCCVVVGAGWSVYGLMKLVNSLCEKRDHFGRFFKIELLVRSRFCLLLFFWKRDRLEHSLSANVRGSTPVLLVLLATALME